MAEGRSNTVGWLVGGVVAYFLLKGIGQGIFQPVAAKQYVQRLRARIEKAKIEGKYVTFDISIGNPNNTPMVINSVVGELWLNQFLLGRVRHFGATKIAPNAESRINLIVKMDGVNALNMLANLLRTVANQQKKQVVTFTGTVNANNRPWPIKEQALIA